MLYAPAHPTCVTDLPQAQVYLVAGPAASGKTTFSSALASHMDAVVLSLDHYFVDEKDVEFEYDEKYGYAPQWESPNAYDTSLIQQNIQQLLLQGEALIPQYSFSANCRTGYQPMSLQPGQPLIVEGLYTIKHQELLRTFTSSQVTIFVSAPFDLRLKRAWTRDIVERGKLASDFERHYHFVSLGEQRWVLEQAQNADFIIQSNTLSCERFFQIPEHS